MAPQELVAPRDPAHRKGCAPVDTQSIRTERPEVLAEDTPHGCYEGRVYLGFEGEDENGEPTKEIERVPCCRCNATERL
jgi:hypothetical protein